ncbi:hypothetical protein BH10ACT9_BH10ACT9_14550 [soil metagenome]
MRQFFGGYFHEDWDLEAKDWQTAVDSFTIEETPTELNSLAEEIDKLVASYSEDELGVVMYRDALSSYYPGPLTYNEWLRRVSERLRQHATAIERGGIPDQ